MSEELKDSPETDSTGNTAPAVESAPAKENVVVGMPAQVTAEVSADTPSTVEPEKPAEPVTLAPVDVAFRKKRDWAGIALDSFLVAALLGVLGGGAWYVNQTMKQYRVPSAMEMAVQENLELCKKRDALMHTAYKSDELIHMRNRLIALDEKLETVQRQVEEKNTSVESLHGRILALQHEIRQEDKTNRSVAKGLLPGMPIGDAVTTDGKIYRDAVIHRLEGNTITLRTPEGQTRFPVTRLVKDKLPDMARYAFGLDDMVDMSDFEAVAGKAKQKPRKGKLITARTPKETKTASIDPSRYEKEGKPVVDTDANKTTTATGLGEEPGTEGDNSSMQPVPNWTPPEGDLPL